MDALSRGSPWVQESFHKCAIDLQLVCITHLTTTECPYSRAVLWDLRWAGLDGQCNGEQGGGEKWSTVKCPPKGGLPHAELQEHLAPGHLRCVQAATILFRPANGAEGDDGNRTITVLYCGKDCVPKIWAGFALSSSFCTFTYVAEPFGIRKNAVITQRSWELRHYSLNHREAKVLHFLLPTSVTTNNPVCAHYLPLPCAYRVKAHPVKGFRQTFLFTVNDKAISLHIFWKIVFIMRVWL